MIVNRVGDGWGFRRAGGRKQCFGQYSQIDLGEENSTVNTSPLEE